MALAAEAEGSIPLLGHTVEVALEDNPMQTFQEWHDESGSRFRASIATMEITFTNDPDDARELHRGQGEFPFRDKPLAPWRTIWKKYPTRPDGIPWLADKAWQDSTRVLKAVLQETDTAIAFSAQVLVHANRLADLIDRIRDSKTGRVKRDLHELYQLYWLEVIIKITLGKDIKVLEMAELTPEWRRLYYHLSEAGHISMAAAKDPKAILGLESEKLNECEACWQDIYVRCERWWAEVHDMKEMNGGSWPESLATDRSIARQMAAEVESKVLRDEDVWSNAAQAVAGSFNPGSQTLEYLLYNVVTRPDVFEKVVGEAREVFPGDSPVQACDLATFERLRWTRGALMESMRFTPTIPYHIRTTVKVTRLDHGKVIVPLGAKCFINYFSMAVDERNFPQSKVFMHDRFLDIPPLSTRDGGGSEAATRCPFAAGKITHSDAYMPFGSGPRCCPAQGLAKVVMELGAAVLFRRFDVSYDGPPLTTVDKVVVTPAFPLGPHFVFRPRS